jgi:hypothetical protein
MAEKEIRENQSGFWGTYWHWDSLYINMKVNFWNHVVFMDLTPYSLVGGYEYTMSKPTGPQTV